MYRKGTVLKPVMYLYRMSLQELIIDLATQQTYETILTVVFLVSVINNIGVAVIQRLPCIHNWFAAI